jgi:hypothetical protein
MPEDCLESLDLTDLDSASCSARLKEHDEEDDFV